MKTMTRSISLCLVVALLAVMLVACGVSEEDMVGTWSGAYVYEGNNFGVGMVFNSDGTYAKVVLKNGQMSSSESGEYEVKGNKVILYDSDSLTYHGSFTEYKYKNGTLENNGHYFTKE